MHKKNTFRSLPVFSTWLSEHTELCNLCPNIHGSTTKWCPLCLLCLDKRLVNHLSEHHVVVSCQAVAYKRSTTRIQGCSSTETLTGVLVGDDAFKEVLLKQADKLNLILDHRMYLAGSL